MDQLFSFALNALGHFIIVQTLCIYRFIEPGSEWRLHRYWFDRSAVADLPWRRLSSGMAVFADQPKISHRILKRPDFALLIRIYRPNRYKTEPKPEARSQNYTLALKLETVAGHH
jgi:hypothetical protein